MRSVPSLLALALVAAGCDGAPCLEVVQAGRAAGTLQLDMSRPATRSQFWQLATQTGPRSARYRFDAPRELRVRRATATRAQCAPPPSAAPCRVSVVSGRYAWNDVRRGFALGGAMHHSRAVPAPRLLYLTLKYQRAPGFYSVWDGSQRVGSLVTARVRRAGRLQWAELWAFDVLDAEQRLSRLRVQRESSVSLSDLPKALDEMERSAVARRAYQLRMDPPEICETLVAAR